MHFIFIYGLFNHIYSSDYIALKGKVEVKVKCTLVQALRLCTGRTAHRGSRRKILETVRKDTVLASFDVQFRILFGWTEENYKTTSVRTAGLQDLRNTKQECHPSSVMFVK